MILILKKTYYDKGCSNIISHTEKVKVSRECDKVMRQGVRSMQYKKIIYEIDILKPPKNVTKHAKIHCTFCHH